MAGPASESPPPDGATERIAFRALLLDQVRNAVIATDMEGCVTYWNRAAEELYGWAEELALGRPLLEVTGPADGTAVAAAIGRSLAERGAWEGELDVVRRDGTVFPARVHDTVVRDSAGEPVGIVRVTLDLTEARAAEEALRESQELFRQLSENIDAVLWLADPVPSGLRYVSPAYERIWGRPVDELLADPRRLAETIHPDDRERVGSDLESVRRRAFRHEYRVVRPDGSVVWVRDSGFPILGPDGEVESVVGLAVDVTEQRELEAQLRQAQKMEAIGMLSGGIAHDFNNLLTAINGYADVVLRALESDDVGKARDAVEEIRRAGARAADLTQQLLAFGRRQVLRPEVVDVNAVVREYASLLERLLGEHVVVDARLEPGLGSVRVDPGQLGQVIVNLAVNARDAMPGGGSLTIASSAVTVDEAAAERAGGLAPGDYVVLTFADTGVGMDEDTCARAFEPFYTTKEQGRGTGLGLPTVLGIVQQSGGAVTVGSEPGAGSTFRVFLPRVDAEAGRPAETREPGPGAGEAVLVVEDEPVVRALVTEILEDAGYRVSAAATPAEALELVRRGGELDLLVTDVVMPQMNGPQLAARVLAERPGIPVLYASGYAGPSEAGRDTVGSGDGFLQKPFSAAELLRGVRAALDSR